MEKKMSLRKCKITVLKKAFYSEIAEKYENEISHACDFQEGDVFLFDGKNIPLGFCSEAWKTVGEYAARLSEGEENFFDGWMKNPRSAVISCNDGVRPVSFLIEVVEND